MLISPSGHLVTKQTIKASASQVQLDTVVIPCSVLDATSLPSDRNSYSYWIGSPAVANDALWRKTGSRCSMCHSAPKKDAALGLSVLASRLRIHSPEKSG